MKRINGELGPLALAALGAVVLATMSGCVTASPPGGPSSLALEVHLTPLQGQPEAQVQQDDRDCYAWTRATKGKDEPLPAAELRYAACAIARGYRAEIGYSDVSSPTTRPLEAVIADLRACDVKRLANAGSGFLWGGVVGAIAEGVQTNRAVDCLTQRGYAVQDTQPDPRAESIRKK